MWVQEKDFNLSPEKIKKLKKENRFNGFTADICGECKKRVNILAGNPGWFCICGHYNVSEWNNHQIPYEYPDLGPDRETINKALK